MILNDYDFNDFTPEAMVNWLSVKLGRKINLLEVPTKVSAVSGAWVSIIGQGNSVQEWIVIDKNLRGFHRHYVFFHEVAHMISGHFTLVLNREELSSLTPEKCIEMKMALRFSNPELFDLQEKQAEEIARTLSIEVAKSQKTIKNPKLLQYLKSLKLG